MTPAALFAGGFAAGLVAGGASCAAVQGGVLIGLARTGGRAAVPAFVAGRLVAHTALGALLGALGEVVRIPPVARAALLVGAGVTVIVFAVRLLLRRRGSCAPDHERTDGEPARSRPWTGAAALGAGTILIPCGVTLGMEAVAVSSGGWLGGAAVMAGFVTGTSPAFALLGLLLRRVAATRLNVLAAAAAIAAGAVTIVAGLRLGGWPPGLGAPAGAAAAGARVLPDGTQVVTVWSTGHGFLPGVAGIEAGRPAEIVFRTRDNQGCTRTLTIQGRDVALPVTGERVVRLPPQRPGRLRYVCGMGMYVGFININRPQLSASGTPPPGGPAR
ncbi:hypothetical protein Skr01_15840 [Sphaerisporangium krabiense]|uniref:Sulfite exporter TauE/SafE n=1 Tax=Sphaerisporangium krabiense TaxID=763782 RepID=A0A7W9DMM8_9ACTN|nr:sulfite exporter TauE/SafE family protein [Sphaerisporangium krabiense]MBB5624546.1 sulfite exporter TauE/SafE [Sphaerisporangium krabiense]GII61499.1 hypothetical protein Skr01_15840 [Sphaerisporangium krabiense]